MSLKKDVKLLTKPYYFLNILLGISYILAKRTSLCHYIFKTSDDICELNGRETEILFFLLIVVMIRSRKTGSVTMINYLTSSFIYSKIANLILWFYTDYRFGIVFCLICIIIGLIFPEPTYSGPEHITYFRTHTALEEEINNNKQTVWIVCFFAVWNPACVHFAPIFASLSAEYNLENLRFGKIDIGRFPEAGRKHRVSNSSLCNQLPTIIVFKEGKEIQRRPLIDSKSKIQKFYFSEDNVRAAFGLNSIYSECVKLSSKKAISSDDTKKSN